MKGFSISHSLFSISSAASLALGLSAALPVPISAAAAAEAAASGDSALAFFEKKVRPVLAGRCYLCHSADTKNAGGLRVDDLNGLLTGGDSGPAIIPGDAEKSPLLQRTRGKDPKKIMPLEGGHVTDEEYADLAAWINAGAAWPKERIPDGLGVLPEKILLLKEAHWAWQPLTEPAPPPVQDEAWPKRPADRFILATLEASGLTPVADAPPGLALRRLCYDLAGLPPASRARKHCPPPPSPSPTAW